jgi:hypothetical protein
VLLANAFDDRPLTVRVVGVDAAGEHELGAASMPLGALVADRAGTLSSDAIAHVALAAAPTDLAPGTVTGFAAAPGPGTASVQPAPRRK